MKGYFQVLMVCKDILKIATATPLGMFTFSYSYFGRCNAGEMFQRLMDSIIGDLPFCVVYTDDILIFSKSKKEYLKHIHKVLQRLQNHGLILWPNKCLFGRSSIKFLGHTITPAGVTPPPSKVNAIPCFPKPMTIKSLQEYIGMVTFYHRFLSGIIKTLVPLYEEQTKACLVISSRRRLWSCERRHHRCHDAVLE